MNQIPIVFLHGFLGSKSDWEPVMSYLKGWQCIGIDLPGHNKAPFSENIEIPYPYFHLVGYSMGGRLAVQYREKHPEKIASLTLLSTHPGLNTVEEKKIRKESDQKWAKLLLELPIDDFLSRWYDQPLFKPFKPDFTMRKNHNVDELVKAFCHFSLSNQKRYDLKDVLVGSRDHKFLSLYERAVIIENSGHAIHLENPEDVAKEIYKRITS